jgi:hypothetical protein
MTHAEFVTAYQRGEIKVEFEPKGAARFLSARLLLPLVMMPILGIGIALALIGWVFAGVATIAIGILLPQLIKRSAPHFLFQQALHDPAVYKELTEARVMRALPVTPDKSVIGD